MATPVPCCLLCGAALPESKCRRSVLSNEGNNVKRVVEDYVRKELCSDRLTQASGIEANDLAIAYLRRSTVLCKTNCYNSVIRLLEKANSFQELNNKLENEVSKSLSAFMLDSGLSAADTTVQSPSVQRKRPPSSYADWTPSRKRLRKESMNTPMRLFVTNTVVEDKSAVAVSI